MHQPHSISIPGLALIESFEGYRKYQYLDAAGKPTIGFGHLIKWNERLWGSIKVGGKVYVIKKGLTRPQARHVLSVDVNKACKVIRRLVKVDLNQHQFDALCSFVYNVGQGNFKRSSLLRKLNAGEYDAVNKELTKWVYAGGRKLSGLIKRRRLEAHVWDGVYPTQAV